MLFVIIIIIFFAMVAIGVSKSIRSLGRKDYLNCDDDEEKYHPDPVYRENMQQAMQDFSTAMKEFGLSISEASTAISSLKMEYDESALPTVESYTLMSAEKGVKEPEPIVEIKKSSVRRIRI